MVLAIRAASCVSDRSGAATWRSVSDRWGIDRLFLFNGKEAGMTTTIDNTKICKGRRGDRLYVKNAGGRIFVKVLNRTAGEAALGEFTLDQAREIAAALLLAAKLSEAVK